MACNPSVALAGLPATQPQAMAYLNTTGLNSPTTAMAPRGHRLSILRHPRTQAMHTIKTRNSMEAPIRAISAASRAALSCSRPITRISLKEVAIPSILHQQAHRQPRMALSDEREELGSAGESGSGVKMRSLLQWDVASRKGHLEGFKMGFACFILD